MSMLARSQKISGATDFQIPHGNFEAASQIRKFLNCSKTLLCHFLQHLILLIHEERIRSTIASSHSSPELVKLGQSHIIRIVDNNGIDIGNIQSGFNNRRGYQYVNVLINKVKHDLFKLLFLHLSMGKRHIGFRDKLLHLGGHICNLIDTVINIIDLSAP